MQPKHERGRSSARIKPLVSLLALASPGCFAEDDVCDRAVEVGDVLQVTVKGPWSDRDAAVPTDPLALWSKPAASCQRDDIEPGDTFSVRLGKDELGHRGCAVPSCSDDFPTPSTNFGGGVAVQGLSYTCLNKHRSVQLSNSCAALRLVALVRRNLGETSAAAGEIPNLLLLRGFAVDARTRDELRCDAPGGLFPAQAPGQEADSFYCADSYAVSVIKR